MLETTPPPEADRVALTNMFKAIAEYGRKVRLRQQVECGKAGLGKTTEPKQDSPTRLPRCKQKHASLEK